MFILATNFLVLRNMAYWQQALFVAGLTILAKVLEFLGEFLIQDVTFDPVVLWVGVINCILWPWLFLLLRRIRRHWHIR